MIQVWTAMLLAVAVTAATPARAEITADLAKKCRALMIKAVPTVVFGPTGSAAQQRAYFQECISRQGRMEEPPRGDSGGDRTTGQGAR